MAKKLNLVLFITFLTLLFVYPTITKAASLYISPSDASYETGDIATLQVSVTATESINAVSGSITVPVSNFSIESVSKTNSILNFWVTEPNFSNSTGIIKFEGVTLGGFSSGSGNILTIRLRAKTKGTGRFEFQTGQVLANDGNGTDVTGSLTGSAFNINDKKLVPAKVVEPEQVIEQPKPVVEEKVQNTSIEVPEIIYGTKYGEPTIYGKSKYVNVTALVTFRSETGSKIYVDTDTDANGEFSVPVPSSLKHGIYTVYANLANKNGSNSQKSNEITINNKNFFADLTWESYSLFGLLLIIIIYQFHKIISDRKNKTGRRSKKDIEDISNIAYKSFEILREDINSKKTSLLKSDIDEAESLIKRKVRDIK